DHCHGPPRAPSPGGKPWITPALFLQQSAPPRDDHLRRKATSLYSHAGWVAVPSQRVGAPPSLKHTSIPPDGCCRRKQTRGWLPSPLSQHLPNSAPPQPHHAL